MPTPLALLCRPQIIKTSFINKQKMVLNRFQNNSFLLL